MQYLLFEKDFLIFVRSETLRGRSNRFVCIRGDGVTIKPVQRLADGYHRTNHTGQYT